MEAMKDAVMTAPTPRHSSKSRPPAIVGHLATPRVQFFAAIAALATVVVLWGLFTLPGGAPQAAPAGGPGNAEPSVIATVSPTVTAPTPCTAGAYSTSSVSYGASSVVERWNDSAALLLAPECPAAQTTEPAAFVVTDDFAEGGCIALGRETVTFCLDLGADESVGRLSVNVADSDPNVLATSRKLLAAALDPAGLRRGGLTRPWPNDSDRLCTTRDSGQLRWSEFQHPELTGLTTLIIERC